MSSVSGIFPVEPQKEPVEPKKTPDKKGKMGGHEIKPSAQQPKEVKIGKTKEFFGPKETPKGTKKKEFFTPEGTKKHTVKNKTGTSLLGKIADIIPRRTKEHFKGKKE